MFIIKVDFQTPKISPTAAETTSKVTVPQNSAPTTTVVSKDKTEIFAQVLSSSPGEETVS